MEYNLEHVFASVGSANNINKLSLAGMQLYIRHREKG
jgi:hypothetical protein